MGEYTELHFNAELKATTPNEVLDVLNYMLTPIASEPQPLPDHPLFETDRWRIMLRCDSYYFDADTHSTLRLDSGSHSHYLCIRCNLKNYNSEIEHFLDWIDPYLEKHEGDFLGFYRADGTEDPTLIRKHPRTIESP